MSPLPHTSAREFPGTLRSERLRIVPGTVELAEAEVRGNASLAELLRVEVPQSWPPETLRDALPLFLAQARHNAGCEPWCLGWYAILVLDSASVLCGSIGFKGAPSRAGVVEVGYSVLPEYQSIGIASEMVAALTSWALSQPDVRAVEAETLLENVASQRVLKKCGFVQAGAGLELGTCRFVHRDRDARA